MQLLLIAGAVLVVVAVGVRLWERVVAGGVQQCGQRMAIRIGKAIQRDVCPGRSSELAASRTPRGAATPGPWRGSGRRGAEGA